MPRIPRGREASIGGVGGVNQVPIIDKADKVVGQVAQNLSNFAGSLLAKRAESATRAYASNTYSRDLIDANEFITKLQLNTPPDGTGFSSSVQSFLDSRLEQRRENAPSEEAYQLYSSKFNEFRTRTLLNANAVENKMATNFVRTNRDILTEEFSGRMVIAPNPEDAINFVNEQEAAIMGEVGLNYSPLDAVTDINKKKTKVSRSLLDGLEASQQPERVLGLLRSTVPEKLFNESLAASGYDAKTIPPENPAIGKIIGEGLTPGEKARRLKSAINSLKQKHKNNSASDIAELRDLSVRLSAYGSSPALSASKELIKGRIFRNSDIKPSQKLQIIDDANMSEALGNAVRRVLEKPLDQRGDITSILREEIAEQREDMIRNDLDSLVDLGYSAEEMQEASRQVSEKHFNAGKVAQITTAFSKSVASATTKLVTQGAEYFHSISNEVAVAGQAVMDPEAAPEERAGNFSKYSRALDTRYEIFGLNTDERKYLTPAMHRFYGRALNNPESAARGLKSLYAIQAEFGDKAKSVFSELVKTGTITEDMYAVSTVDPRYSEQLEPIYAMARVPGQINEVMKTMKFSESEGIELNKAISDKMEDMRLALRSADPSGGNTHLITGLERLYKAAVVNDGKDSIDKSIKKWEKVFTYPIAKSSDSNLIIPRDMEQEIPNVEDFINEFDNERSLNALHKKMGITLDPFNSPIRINGETLPVENIRALVEAGHGDLVRKFHKDMVNEQVEWVMAPDGASAMEVLKGSDGVIRPRRDSNGRKIVIPYEKMKEYTVDDFVPQKFGEMGRFGDYDEDGKLIIPKSVQQIKAEEDAANKAIRESGSVDLATLASTDNTALEMLTKGLGKKPSIKDFQSAASWLTDAKVNPKIAIDLPSFPEIGSYGAKYIENKEGGSRSKFYPSIGSSGPTGGAGGDAGQFSYQTLKSNTLARLGSENEKELAIAVLDKIKAAGLFGVKGREKTKEKLAKYRDQNGEWFSLSNSEQAMWTKITWMRNMNLMLTKQDRFYNITNDKRELFSTKPEPLKQAFMDAAINGGGKTMRGTALDMLLNDTWKTNWKEFKDAFINAGPHGKERRRDAIEEAESTLK